MKICELNANINECSQYNFLQQDTQNEKKYFNNFVNEDSSEEFYKKFINSGDKFKIQN